MLLKDSNHSQKLLVEITRRNHLQKSLAEIARRNHLQKSLANITRRNHSQKLNQRMLRVLVHRDLKRSVWKIQQSYYDVYCVGIKWLSKIFYGRFRILHKFVTMFPQKKKQQNPCNNVPRVKTHTHTQNTCNNVP